MIEITDNISKIMSKDSQNGYSVLTYIDINIEFTEVAIEDFLNAIIQKFPIMRQHIVEKDSDSDVFLEYDTEFNIKNHYKIIYDTVEKFDVYTDTILNLPFGTKSKWLFHCIADKDSKKYRIYFKIDHSYADGYKIIEMLMSPLNITDTSKIFKHRTTNMMDTLYYMIFGTLVLFINFFKILVESLLLLPNKPVYGKTEHLRCKPFKLSEIKRIAHENKITVNDFLYALLIKTDSLYTNARRDIVISSPINISGSKHLNNIAPVINKIRNTMENKELLDNIHTVFDSYKYSLYIPIFSFILHYILPFLPFALQTYVYNSIIQRCDYIYSNIIGPSHETLKDIHFLTLAKDKEIVFNIISSNDNINIICSFKEGVIGDTVRFEECIYAAYESLSHQSNN
jgi:hypothetical protein